MSPQTVSFEILARRSTTELVHRIRQIDEAMEAARTHLSELADERSRIAAAIYAGHGPTEGARLLGINRNSLYRIVQRFLAGEGLDVDPDSRRQIREALKALVAGVAVGAAAAAVSEASGHRR
jgi:Homeodomain-like domain